MKNSIKFLFLIVLGSIATSSYAQFQMIGVSDVYETQSSVKKIGIGDYATSTSPMAS